MTDYHTLYIYRVTEYGDHRILVDEIYKKIRGYYLTSSEAQDRANTIFAGIVNGYDVTVKIEIVPALVSGSGHFFLMSDLRKFD